MTDNTAAPLNRSCDYLDSMGRRWQYADAYGCWINLTEGGKVRRGYSDEVLVAACGPLRPVPRRLV